MRTSTKVDWSDADPISTRGKVLGTMKTFKRGVMPPDNAGFPDRAPRTQIDTPYTPHKGGEKQ